MPYTGETTTLNCSTQPYAPRAILDRLGITVVTTWLRDTWGLWLPDRRTVVVAENLNPIQERCTLAHEVEHVLAADFGCGTSTDITRSSRVRAERHADREAARKLIGISDLALVAQRGLGTRETAIQLEVTERLLAIRLDDLEGEAWPDTLKIAG